MNANSLSRLSCIGEAGISVREMRYIGLPSALGLAGLGWNVVGTDIGAAKIASLSVAQCPFHEPGLPELLFRDNANPRFQLTNSVAASIGTSSGDW